MSKITYGQKVYISELEQFGRAHGFDLNGNVTHVIIDGIKGPEIIDIAFNGYRVYTLIQQIIRTIKKLLKRRKKIV